MIYKSLPSAILILLLSCCACITTAQIKIEPANYKTFYKQFVIDYNNSNYSRISAKTTPQFLKSIPEPKLIAFLEEVKKAYGKIRDYQFKKFDEKNSAVYYTALEKTDLKFMFTLDNTNKMTRFVVLPPNYNEELPLVRNKTKMQLPFKSEWFVFWGGDKQQDNYHSTNKAQKNAFDFVIMNERNITFKTTGKTNEDYYAFGQQLFSPCKGEVVSVIDGVNDNVPGVMNPAQLVGNSVIIKTINNEYVLLAHFKKNSITVKKGEKVNAGKFIGLCGNSGNSSEPHVHMHLMSGPDLKKATGIKCFFEKLSVNGKVKNDYSPVKSDRVKL